MKNQPRSGGGVAKRRRCIGGIIPEEIVEQILLRLPVKSIVRFRSVCKSWQSMIADPRLARLHLQFHHSTTSSMLVLPCYNSSNPEMGRMESVSFFRYPGHGAVAKLLAQRSWPSGVTTDWGMPLHCNGLVLVFSSSQIFVSNPATRELVLLPRGTPVDDEDVEHSVGFGADPSTGQAKVVRCFTRYCDWTWTIYSVGCEVLSIGEGGDTAWRTVADSPYLLMTTSAPCVNGAIYWIAVQPPPHTGFCDVSDAAILRFDLRNEEFADFPCPPCLKTIHNDFEPSTIYDGILTELGGKLCFSHALDDNLQRVELWTASSADDGTTPRWSRHCTVVLLEPARNFVIPFAVDSQGSIFFNVDFDVICRYDPERRVVEHVVDMNQQMNYYFRSSDKCFYMYRGSEWRHYSIQYKESLVSIKAN